MRLAPLTAAVHEEPLSACAFAVVRSYEQSRQIRSLEADNDAFVAMAVLGVSDEKTVVEEREAETVRP